MTPTLDKIYARLIERFGPQRFSPAETCFELLIAAVLSPQASSKNVVAAVENLRETGLLDARRLVALPDEELEELIRPAGHFRAKARRLRSILALLVERYDASPEQMFAAGVESLRRDLLAINGIGPETADSILLSAGNLPSFVVDASTHRVLKRHGWLDFSADYQEIKDYFESSLDRDPALYREFHALLERVGNDYCRTSPQCDACPLADLLPDGGPLKAAEF